MKRFAPVLGLLVLMAAAGIRDPGASGQTVACDNAPYPKVSTKAPKASGNPKKASSFAPHPGKKRQAYGAPISRPILRHVAPKKPKSPQ